MHSTPITLKLVKRFITDLNSLKVFGPDCFPVLLVKHCGTELSCILAKFSNICLKKCCILDWWKVVSVITVFKNVWERCMTKNFCWISFLSVVSKISEKKIIGLSAREIWPFSWFQYGFKPSYSTVDLLTVVFVKIASAFNRYGATQAITLDILGAMDNVWHSDLFHKHESYWISGRTFSLPLFFFINRWLLVVLDRKSNARTSRYWCCSSTRDSWSYAFPTIN